MKAVNDLPLLLDSRRIRAEDELCGGIRELRESSDGEVLVVDLLLGFELGFRLYRCPKREELLSPPGIASESVDRPLLYCSSRREWQKHTHLLHDWKHPRLAVIVPVCSYAQVHLLGILVRLVGRSELEDAVDGALIRWAV